MISINIPLLMEILVEKLKPPIDENYVRNKKYDEIDFINVDLEHDLRSVPCRRNHRSYSK